MAAAPPPPADVPNLPPPPLTKFQTFMATSSIASSINFLEHKNPNAVEPFKVLLSNSFAVYQKTSNMRDMVLGECKTVLRTMCLTRESVMEHGANEGAVCNLFKPVLAFLLEPMLAAAWLGGLVGDNPSKPSDDALVPAWELTCQELAQQRAVSL